MQYTQEQIKEKFESLPLDVKEAISSVDTTNTILKIGEKYRIQIDELGELVDETGLVMLGFVHPGDFVSGVKKRLNIPQDLAETLVREINNEIFLKIRESIRKISEKAVRLKKEKEHDFSKEEQPTSFVNNNNVINPSQDTSPDKNLDRDILLKEIEDHTDDIKNNIVNTSAVKKDEEIKKDIINDFNKPSTEVIKSNLPTEPIETDLIIPQKNNIVENKLSGVIKMPIVEKKISEKTEQEKERLKIDYKTMDPYREPIE